MTRKDAPVAEAALYASAGVVFGMGLAVSGGGRPNSSPAVTHHHHPHTDSATATAIAQTDSAS